MAETRHPDERNPRSAEYALIVALVVISSSVLLVVFAGQLGDVLGLIADRIHE